MEHFTSIMERDYGFKSGKNAPMVSGSPGGSSGGGGYSGMRKSVPGTRMSANAGVYGQEDPFGLGRKSEGSKSGRSYGSRDDLFSPAAYDDVFGGPPKSADTGTRYDDVFGGAAHGGPVYDDLLGGYSGPASKVKSTPGSFQDSPRRSDRNHSTSSEPVYDELIPGFGFMPKSRVSSEPKATHETDPFGPSSADAFATRTAAGSGPTFDDDGLLPGFDSGKSRTASGDAKSSRQSDPLMPIFDDPISSGAPPAYGSLGDEDGLLPRFGRDGNKSRSFREADTSSPAHDSFPPTVEDPSLSNVPGESPPFDDLLNVFDEPPVPPSSSSSRGPGNGIKADRFDSFDSFPSSPGNSGLFKDTPRKPTENASRTEVRNATGFPEEAPSVREGYTGDDISEVSPDSDPFFPSQSESGKSPDFGLGSSEMPEKESPSWDVPVSDEPQGDPVSGSRSPSKEWLTVDDMKLLTKPTTRPPPSRRPPPVPGSGSRSGQRDKSEVPNANFVPSSATFMAEDDLTGNSAAQHSAPPSYEQAVPGWKDFNFQSSRDEERERAEAKAAKERRRQEREEAKLARERDAKEREARQAKEQERLRREKEREKDKAAVRLATLEARERAAQEAKEKAERTAVERATGEARERAASQARERARVERAAVERATAEARERAASEAREVREREARAAAESRERATAESRERAAAESRERAAAESRGRAAAERAVGEVRERAERAVRAAAEKAAVERAQTEARERAARAAAEKAAVERAAAEARERAERAAAERAAAARAQQQRKSENDLESFFANSGTPAPSDSKQRSASMNNNTNVFGEPRRTSSGTATTTASVDDWTSMFTDDSQGRKGEFGKPSKARSDRYEHSRQRAAKAIAEINQRDLETQREQAEKQRAGEVLDAEIKRWAAGKEGNLRALLSTLQYVLWPECGWTPVSLTDLISPASVKKTYRKAALYVHPDKVQQKGATVQQKYIAEKVFDLLKEAFNKFNSEEFF